MSLSRDKDKKMTSGHSAGLQSTNTFRNAEKDIRTNQNSYEINDPTLTGENAETVYRDKRGRKLDMLNEFMRQTSAKEGREYKIEKAQYEWGSGTVQKKQQEDKQKEIEEMADQPFARRADDPKLEAIRKQEIRDGDPMAAFFLAKKTKYEEHEEEEETSKDRESTEKGSRSSGYDKYSAPVTKTRKPSYKGPVPKPNRFKIPPGYRWDAVDRGNGFEHKLLVKMSSKSSYRDDEYKYLSSDL